MGDQGLEAIRQRQMQEMMAQHDMASHHNPRQQKEQEAAKREADEQRQLMLSQILSVQARERSSDLLANAKRGPKDDVRLKVHADKTFCAATCDEDETLIVSGAEDATSALHQEQSNNASCYCHGVKMQEKLHTVKRQTRQWAAWTRQEEENFFLALRQVGKNFEKITCRVQSKNRDQVRHYYYRLVRRINKLLAPGFCLDAKNSKDTIAAMLRWWSLLEKFSCSASKLHLKPRRLKIFREALELQLLKDRNKGRKKHLSQGANLPSVPLAMIFNRTSENGSCSVKLLQVDSHNSQKIRATKAATLKRNTATNSDFASSQKSVRQNRRTVSIGESAAYRRWEKAAIAGVSLVADAAEQLEHVHHDRNTFSNQKISAVACSGDKDAHSAGDDECPVPYLMLRGTSPHQSRETATHSSAKLKLQLFPIDEVTRRALEKDAQNPHLELILSARKRISSVVEHLNRKWGKSTIASGELMLLPYVVHQNDIANSHRWTIKDTVASAADVYATIGSPTIFRLRYGWFPIASPGSGVQVLSLALQPEKHIQVEDVHQLYASNAVPIGNSTEGDDSDPSKVCCTSPNVSHQFFCSRCEKEEGDDKEVDPGMRNEATFTAVEWADSLMSVGDLLSEASKAANSAGTSLTANIQQLQFSNDSFDAAIAAHIAGHYSTRLPTQLPLSSIWHAEETCDGFSIQLASVARQEHSNPLTSMSNGDGRENTCTKSMDFQDYLKDLTVPSTLNELSIEDIKCGSKSHGEMPSDGRMHDFPTESGKQMFSDAKDPSLTDIFWPDSLGPVVLEMPSSKYHSQDIIIEESAPLGGLSHQIISSLDGF